ERALERIDTAVGGAAVVGGRDRNGNRPVRVGGRRVGQRLRGPSTGDGRVGHYRGVAGNGRERHGLARFVGAAAGTDAGDRYGLGGRVLVDGLIADGIQDRRVVDGVDGNRERALERINAAVRRAADIGRRDGDRHHAIRVGDQRVGQRPR